MAHGYYTFIVLSVGGVYPTFTVQLEERPTVLEDELKRLGKFTKLHLPHFHGTPSGDAHVFLDYFHEIMHNLGLVESNEFDFTAF